MAPKPWSKPKHEEKKKKFSNPSKEFVSKEESHLDFVKFSFKYLLINETFKYSDRETGYFTSLIERLRIICGMPCQEFIISYKKPLRNHYINWDDTSQSSFGLPNEEQLVERPFQFGISANEHGRVIGFFIERTFYIVWFDPNHEVYS